MASTVHVPVLVEEVARLLQPKSGQLFIDGTLGGGGHTRLLAGLVGDAGRVIAFERDPEALAAAEKALAGLPVTLVQSNFCDLPQVLEQLDISAVDGILLDLGLSSDQLADRERGFSFDSDGPLDLRFDPGEGEPAWRLINRMSEKELADTIYQFGEERFSRRIARAVSERRNTDPIRTARELADLVRRCVPRAKGVQRIDPATRTFQALRIAVNDELGSLDRGLERLPGCLREGGRMAVVSFHSLEDRRVKNAFRDDPRLEVITKKPVLPSEEEVARNPRARSAKLRAAIRKTH